MTAIRVEVRDRVTDEPIPYAVVSLGEKKGVADEFGKITFDIPEEVLGDKIKLSIRSAHYEPWDKEVEIKKRGLIVRIRPEVI